MAPGRAEESRAELRSHLDAATAMEDGAAQNRGRWSTASDTMIYNRGA